MCFSACHKKGTLYDSLKSTSEQINGVWKYTVTIFIADYGECVCIPMLLLYYQLCKKVFAGQGNGHKIFHKSI